MIDRDLKLIFVHIQKTGGMAISRALGGIDHPPEKHRTALELRTIYGEAAWNQCTKFAFVRNPWDRLVSWWSMIDGRRDQMKMSQSGNVFFNYVLENATNFEEFLFNCQDEIHDMDGHKWIFRNQLDYLLDEHGDLMVDFIGRFELLEDNFKTFTSQYLNRSYSISKINASNHSKYQKYYTEKTRLLVANAYKKDIDAFGYTF
jgi:chondroitin 4-sulfotransferase 11